MDRHGQRAGEIDPRRTAGRVLANGSLRRKKTHETGETPALSPRNSEPVYVGISMANPDVPTNDHAEMLGFASFTPTYAGCVSLRRLPERAFCIGRLRAPMA